MEICFVRHRPCSSLQNLFSTRQNTNNFPSRPPPAQRDGRLPPGQVLAARDRQWLSVSAQNRRQLVFHPSEGQDYGHARAAQQASLPSRERFRRPYGQPRGDHQRPSSPSLLADCSAQGTIAGGSRAKRSLSVQTLLMRLTRHAWNAAAPRSSSVLSRFFAVGPRGG